MRLRTFRRGVLAVPAVLLLAVLLVSLATPYTRKRLPWRSFIGLCFSYLVSGV